MNMEINSNRNNLTFGTRLVVVSPKGLSEVRSKYKKFTNIFHYNILTNINNNLYNCYQQNVKRGYTSGVKTCTAGVCVKKGQKAPLFWHIENTKYNMENFPILGKLIEGKNAVIIGSKKGYQYSSEMFHNFAEHIKQKNIPSTIIKGTKNSEVELFYLAPQDTLYMCIRDIWQRDKHVSSMQDLLKACDTVQISQTDSIEFYDILPKETLMKKFKKFFSL